MHGTSRCAREGLATLRDPNARLPSGHLGRLRAHWRSAECWHRCLAGPGGQGGCMRPPSCTKSMCSNARDLQTFGTDEVPCKRETCREGLRFAPSQRRAKRARVCTMRTCRLRLHVDFDLRAIARPRVHLLGCGDRSSAPRSEGLQSSHRDSAWQSPKWSVRRTTDPGS